MPGRKDALMCTFRAVYLRLLGSPGHTACQWWA